MLYDVFNGNASAQQIASQIGGDLVKRFAPNIDVGGLINSLTIKINATDGFAWTDLAGVISDIAGFIASYIPQAKVVTIATAFWDYSSLL
ncbi:hypothetical protein FXW05_07390 [Staphylococcus pseudintermedius]|uniref:Uncharacterized protein n=1 Tax=Staphylococcus pseudintermedius TaxID=283734 RepID=A0A7T7NYP3_STAPS|nr:hypothetical protein [Staphylococcus pseudintermedius]EJA1894754.1 hypothetical protein [Staphylococcus pseudintermedius]KAB7709990.1 hypothetical protein F9842_06570 [Staphylococcus pseudintermedius]MBC8697417.1 hypothetical protein [Staphylococcus pseudintermedius]MBJ8244232.1 hypothetical protein [Staphylococcus pseudintermedius]MBJ8255712.1 hypothetical protein [Staphylococcus pseudintermedius]